MAIDQTTRSVILIAERDANVRELQTVFLNRAGYSVEFADDGQMALDHARVLAPVLLVTEILIPKIDGLALCRRVRDDVMLRDLPVLVFSILAAGSRAQEAGATAFLRKPLVESTFTAEVAAAIAAKGPSQMEQEWPRLSSRPTAVTLGERAEKTPSSD
jgi:CheY-like chemotaxis protein